MYAKDHRQAARAALKGNWGMAVLVALLATLLGGLICGVGFGFNISLSDVDANVLANLPPVVLQMLATWAGFSGILIFVQFVMGGVVKLGHCQYTLALHNGQQADVKDLFSQLSRLLDGFLLNLLTSLFIALWSLLLVIPGIIAMYRYAMAPFILYENPGMSAMDAIRTSKAMMKGHKWELFCLNLSFIGWALLGALTCGIGLLFVNPYMSQAYASFYQNLKGGPASTYEAPNPYLNDL